MKTNNKRTIRRDVMINIAVFSVLLAICTILSIVFMALYANTMSIVFLILSLVYILFLIGDVVFIGIRIVRKFTILYTEGLVSITKENMEKITNHQYDIKEYPVGNIIEFEELNKSVRHLKTDLGNTIFISKEANVEDLPITFLDKKRRIVEYYSFKEQIRNVIAFSQSFRNILIEMYYVLDNQVLEELQQERLMNLIYDTFKDFNSSLFMRGGHGDSFFIYLPHIDSINQVIEKINILMKDTTVVTKVKGINESTTPHFSVVCYPYSDVDNIFSDLRYCKRQAKLLNVYFPNRINNFQETTVLQTSMNHNFMSKILYRVKSLEQKDGSYNSDRKVINDVFMDLHAYLNYDYAGLITLNENTDEYRADMILNFAGDEFLEVGQKFNSEYMDVLAEKSDPDKSLFFSKRSSVGSDLGKVLDKFNVESGMYYITYDGPKNIGILFIFNKDKPLELTSYLRESLYILFTMISNGYINMRRSIAYNDKVEEMNNVLMLSDYELYKIDEHNYHITYMSDGLKKFLGKFDLSLPCHKILYGLDKPCRQCPLKTGKHMQSKVKDRILETSLSMNNKRSFISTLLVRRMNENEVGYDRYDRELLISSYGSLVNYMSNQYLVHGRGYLLLLHVDNISKLVSERGSESALFVLRSFIKILKEKEIITENIFSYNDQTLALLVPEAGQKDIIEKCEQIYEVTKQRFFDTPSEDFLSISYFPLVYPQGYPTAQDFLKYVDRTYINYKYEKNRDFIYLTQENFSRTASRELYMIDVIKESFSSDNFKLLIQPAINIATGRIERGEVLMNIKDNVTNSILNNFELINIARKNNLTHIISSSIFNRVGIFYEKNIATFNATNLKKICINTDYAYFAAEQFIPELTKTLEQYGIEKGYLLFEIGEKDLYDHIDEAKATFDKIRGLNISLTCDSYTGRFVSLNKLKELGISSIKIDRNITRYIDTDPDRLREIRMLMQQARELGMDISIIGVENAQQVQLLENLNIPCLLQGYYYSKPLEEFDFVARVKKS